MSIKRTLTIIAVLFLVVSAAHAQTINGSPVLPAPVQPTDQIFIFRGTAPVYQTSVATLLSGVTTGVFGPATTTTGFVPLWNGTFGNSLSAGLPTIGTGSVVLNTSPTVTNANLITPSIGVATGTSLALGGITLGTAILATPTLKVGGSTAAVLGNAVMVVQRQSPSVTDGFDFHGKRVAHTGGTAGNGNAFMLIESIVPAGTQVNENGITVSSTYSTNFGDASQGAPVFSQGIKNSTGFGFGFKANVSDLNKTTTPTNGAVGAEIAVKASHPDPGVTGRSPFGNRTGVHINGGALDSGFDGTPPGFESGLKITGDSTATIHYGIEFTSYTPNSADDTQFVNLIGVLGATTVPGDVFNLNDVVPQSNLITMPGFVVGNTGIAQLSGNTLIAPAAPGAINTSLNQSGMTKILAFANASMTASGQKVSGANIPANDYVVSKTILPMYASKANGISASGQKLLNVVFTEGAEVKQQCVDITTPGAIGDGNVIDSITSGVIHLHSNLVNPTVDQDVIQCYPTVTIAAATTGTDPSGTAITFGASPATVITGSNQFPAGIIADTNAFAPGAAIVATQNFGTDAAGTYESYWRIDGSAQLTALTITGALNAGTPLTPGVTCTGMPTGFFKSINGIVTHC